jgi:hypothetical protein
MIYLVAAVLMSSCDTYKEDVPAVIDYKVKYAPNEPILINLGAFIDQGNSKSFIIKGSPTAGNAEILAESFLMYAPTSNTGDQITVEMFDASNNSIGEARVSLEASATACGIAKFDYGEVQNGTELSINLADNDQLCEPIREALLMYTPIENADGLFITIPPKANPNDPSEQTIIKLTYNAPAGFHGVARGLYVTGINLKDEYQDQWGTDELLINPAEKFKYFVASLVEIHVTE